MNKSFDQPKTRCFWVLRVMPPLYHSTDERKAFGGKFVRSHSAVAKYLMERTRLDSNTCFTMIDKAWEKEVILYRADINRYCGCDYKGPMPTTKEAGPDRLLKEREKARAKKRKKDSKKVVAKKAGKAGHTRKKTLANRKKSLVRKMNK